MRHRNRMGVNFTTTAEGIGDLRLTALTPLLRQGRMQLTGGMGISIPTGSIDETDATPLDPGATRNLPYPMQLGSGTWDLLPTITLAHHGERLSWGAQANLVVRLGRNSNDYALGDRFEVNSWVGYRVVPAFRIDARLAYECWRDVDGADPEVMQSATMMGMTVPTVPTARPNLRAGQRLTAYLGFDWEVPASWIPVGKSARLGFEIGTPLWRDLDGPQLDVSIRSVIGLQIFW